MAEQSSLVRLKKEYDLEVDLRGYELHPEIPVGGVAITSLFPEDRVKSMHSYLTGFAKKFGIEDLCFSDHVPNTRRALAISEYARDQGKLVEFWDAAMEAYWRGGQNVENPEDLRRILDKTSLDPEPALSAMDDPAYQQRVDRIREEGLQKGVPGIPAFFFGDAVPPVIGCQPYEMLEAAARKAGAKRR